MPAAIQLTGENAFYLQPNPEDLDQLARAKPEVAYTCCIEKEDGGSRVWQIVKNILCSPYCLVHYLAGLVILRSAFLSLGGIIERYLVNYRVELLKGNEGWTHKRLAVGINGMKIDAMVIGKPETFDNGKWLLFSSGNGAFYEGVRTIYQDYETDLASRYPDGVITHHLYPMLSKINANAVIFNYPGVGASTGWPVLQNLIDSYKGMLNFLEEGLKAKKIIGWGWSIGAGIQAEALRSHDFKENVEYLWIKDRTFSRLSDAVSNMLYKIVGVFIRFFGWEMDCVNSSKELKTPEVIVQSGKLHFSLFTRAGGELLQEVGCDGMFMPEDTLYSELEPDYNP